MLPDSSSLSREKSWDQTKCDPFIYAGLMAILTKLQTLKIASKIVQYNERLVLFPILCWSTSFRGPRRNAAIKIHHIGFSAVRAEVKIIVRKGPVYFFEKRLGHKEGAAFLAGLHLDRPDLLLGEDPEKISRTDLVPEFRCVFRACIHAGSAADALVVGVIEDPERAFVHGFECACGTAQLAGGASRAPAGIHPGSAKEEDRHEDHGFPAQNVDQPHVVPQKSDFIQGAVCKKPAGEKRKSCDDNNHKVRP